jgi:hypothetical protein
VAVRLNTTAATFLSVEMTVYEIATLKGISSVAGWWSLNFQIG